MKHFKLILTVTRIVVSILLGANIIFMILLYDSIKQRYIEDVEQCLVRADQIETVDRIVAAGLEDEDGVVWVKLGLQKSEVGDATTKEELEEEDYSQGYRRSDRQLLDAVSLYLHTQFGDSIGRTDTRAMEKAFRRDLNFSGFYPEEVYIVGPGEALEFDSDLWEIEYSVNDEITYFAYISPLTKNILREMSGVLITSLLLFIALTLGFWYLLHVIKRLRSIEEMKDDFVSNMTHELKTPIAIAYSANDALLNFPDAKDEERTKTYLKAALDQLSRLSGLVEKILSMSMERRKNPSISPERIELKPFLETIIEHQRIRDDKQIEFELTCSDDATIEADPTHLANIINNLIDNSIKYSRESVKIKIQADSVKLSVTDNGIGIPAKSLSEIFKKFYRVPKGNRQDTRGYGIGLFYVKSMIDRFGWSIEVESKENKGTKFTINYGRQDIAR